MAFKLEHKGNKNLFGDINVTPLVDIVLVLLIIFMLTAPLLLNGIKLSLPKTREVNKMNLNSHQVILSLTRSGDLYLGKNKVLKTELLPEIKELFKQNSTEIVYLRADYGMKYGDVTNLMSYLKRGGIENIALVTELDKQAMD